MACQEYMPGSDEEDYPQDFAAQGDMSGDEDLSQDMMAQVDLSGDEEDVPRNERVSPRDIAVQVDISDFDEQDFFGRTALHATKEAFGAHVGPCGLQRICSPPPWPAGETIMVQGLRPYARTRPLKRPTWPENFDEEAWRRGFKGLETDIPRGERLWFYLLIPGLEIDDPVQTLRWSGRTESVQFAVTAPADCLKRNVIGTVEVSLGEHRIPVGHVKFRLARWRIPG